MASADLIEVPGVIVDQFANGKFTVRLDSGQQVTGYVTGKMRRHNIRCVVADRVVLQLSPLNPAMGRIVFRER